MGNLFAWEHLNVLPEELEEGGERLCGMDGWAGTTGLQFINGKC